MTRVKVERKDDLTDEEIKQELITASKIKNLYRRRRAQAVIALLETGKRRSEIASLKKEDVTQDEKYLYVRFTVRKKRKKSENILQRTKKFNINSDYSIILQRYLAFLSEKIPSTEYLFPKGHCIFGHSYTIDPKQPINPKEIWRIVKQLNPRDWPHLHRERRAVKVIKADEKKFGQANLDTVYRIKRCLDLEREQTAYNYINRHETQKVEDEEDEI
jgi:integrase